MLKPEELKEITDVLGKQAADEIKNLAAATEKKLETNFEEFKKGTITKEQYNEALNKIKEVDMSAINDKLAKIEEATNKLEEVTKAQGNKINAVLEKSTGAKKTLEQFIAEQVPQLTELRKSGKMVEFTATQLKDAGVTSIAGSVQDMTSPPASPYAPGLGGADLEIFDIARNPNYVINHVDLGRTNQSRLAWINETVYEGAPAEVAEGGPKPLTQHKFQVEISSAKKMAAYIKLTDEFENDIPQLATKVRRMLVEDVLRGWDDAIQTAVIAAARPYEITGLDDAVVAANYWDALLSMGAQVRYYNFTPNTIGINPITNVVLKTAKSTEDNIYLVPSFAGEIEGMLTQANKVANGNAFVGDLKQFKVDIYKEMVIKMGWVNDDFINNEFCILAEIRYHRYISDARKKAICYDRIQDVVNAIDTEGGSL